MLKKLPTPTPPYIFFWGHHKSKDGSINKSCLSQWWSCEFSEEGISYTSTEQWMMAEKARLFENREMLAEILRTHDPKAVKALGRKVANFQQEVWLEHRYDIVKRGNQLKFSQNAELGAYLLSTAPATLVEASPYDRIWGIGLRESDPRAQNPEKWQGENLLGFVLMEVRQGLSTV